MPKNTFIFYSSNNGTIHLSMCYTILVLIWEECPHRINWTQKSKACSIYLQNFTGHASPVSHLLFIPSSLSHDSNANHVPSNGVSSQYFISGAEQDRLMNIW